MITAQHISVMRGPVGPLVVNTVTNGNFALWSNGTTFVNPGSSTLTADGWTTSNCDTVTISRVAGINGSTYAMQLQGTASQSSFKSVYQSLPLATLNNQVLTVSLDVKCDTPNVFEVRLIGDTTDIIYVDSGTNQWTSLSFTVPLSQVASEFDIQLGLHGDAASAIATVDNISVGIRVLPAWVTLRSNSPAGVEVLAGKMQLLPYKKDIPANSNYIIAYLFKDPKANPEIDGFDGMSDLPGDWDGVGIKEAAFVFANGDHQNMVSLLKTYAALFGASF